MRKKSIFIIIMLLYISMFSMTIFADVGPKPSIYIAVRNMPTELCYMDLLVMDNGNKMYIEDGYNQQMLQKLVDYENGWIPFVATNPLASNFNSILCDVKNGKCNMSYGYTVPGEFKVIVVTESYDVVVSNLIKPKAYNSKIYFDYKTGKAYEKSPLLIVTIEFIKTLLLTLIIEGLLLRLFGFDISKNYKPLIIINLITQFLLYLLLYSCMVSIGVIVGIILYILFELIVLIIEAILFGKYLFGHSLLRRVVFALVANITSFILGAALFIITVIYI